MICTPNDRNAAWLRSLLIPAVFILFTGEASARFEFDARCRDTYKAILSLRMEQSAQLLADLQRSDPGNGIVAYLENYSDFLEVFITEDPQRFDRFRQRMDARTDRIKNSREESPWYAFTLASMRLQFAMTRLKFGEYKQASFDIAQVYGEFEENARKYPDFLPGQTGLGLIHVVAGMIPENYAWVLSLLGIDGDIGRGLGELSGVALYDGNDEVYRLFSTEALFYLALVDASMGKDKKEPLGLIRSFDRSGKEFPGPSNPLYIFIKATILMRNGLNEEAIKCLDSYRKAPGDLPFSYLDYLNGLARLNRLDPEAEWYLLRFSADFIGKNYVKSAYQKLAWNYLLRGDTVKYHDYMARVKARGELFVDADRQAEREAGNGEVPNVTLLRARLLFDGGYFDRAMDELLDKSIRGFVRTKREMVEYTYRLGRICHESGNSSKALTYYEQTIRSGEDQPWYFAANAAFQSGMIYESRNDRENAAKFYRLCLSMKNTEYKTSLDQKARAGLKRVQR